MADARRAPSERRLEHSEGEVKPHNPQPQSPGQLQGPAPKMNVPAPKLNVPAPKMNVTIYCKNRGKSRLAPKMNVPAPKMNVPAPEMNAPAPEMHFSLNPKP